VPDCTNERYADWYVGTFVMSIFWIGFLSFVMCDFSIRVGCVLGIPGLLMGLVFIAAGTSVPDALSSVAVGKSGMGDMAVANVLGSNIFNILLGLGLPW
jgi:Ca2+/Na+ antiporter